MENLDNYAELRKQLESLCKTRRNGILAHMLKSDDYYKGLCRRRAEASMALKTAIAYSDVNMLFDEYSDSIYAQEVYELDAVYKQAIADTLCALSSQGLLKEIFE